MKWKKCDTWFPILYVIPFVCSAIESMLCTIFYLQYQL